MIAATTQSTTMQNGGYQRVLAGTAPAAPALAADPMSAASTAP